MIIAHLLIGALAMTAVLLLINYTQKQAQKPSWWQWMLTVLCILYTVFVLELIVGFFAEGAPQAALVMGLVTGIFAIIWGVLLRRFVFTKAA
ncbi:MAG: hypothetical protein DWQ04_14670 [Chloroflexi bacterium]|nr:MAG: hypothetical protein DWQ04_14670 [Chloroflexota bacterium]